MSLPNSLRRLLPATLALLLLISTRVWDFADTRWYAVDLLAREQGDSSRAGVQFWEFGHLIWRPLGYVFYRIFKPVLGGWFGWSDYSAARFALIFIAGLSLVPFAYILQAMARRITGSWTRALLITTALLASDAVLLRGHAGSSYIPGLLFLTLGVALMTNLISDGGGGNRGAFLAGLALACAALLWIPYLLSIPSAILAGLLWNGDALRVTREEFRRWIVRALVCGITAGVALGVVYVIAIRNLGIHSTADLLTWFHSASHGMQPKQNLKRMIAGLARGFIATGDTSLLFKRYVFHDPYTPITRWDLLRGLPLFALFYATLAVLAWILCQSRRLLAALAVLLCGTAPVIALALYFEAGSPERYLAIAPFLAIALAAVYAPAVKFPTEKNPRISKSILAASLAVTVAFNVAAYWRPSFSADWSGERERMDLLRSRVQITDRVWLLFGDRLVFAEEAFGFDSPRLQLRLPLRQIPDLDSVDTEIWREQFAGETLDMWNRHREVWISERLLADRPLPGWIWVETGDPAASWPRIHDFSRHLQLTAEAGGPDGFARIVDTPMNRAFLQGFLQPADKRR